jgi:hypothetical protein
MTADQLLHLAQLNDEAAQYAGYCNPSLARRFHDAASAARKFAAEEASAEVLVTIKANLAQIKAQLR